jgi:phosphoribosyl-AMP cyclohydrolase
MNTKFVVRPNFEKRGGLVTVVAQDANTREVLMVAYTDEAGWRKTLQTGLGSYYSTSRKKSWIKGEESGNFQKVTDILIDCDGDALVYLVEPQGPGLACHTNARSCFYRHATKRFADDPAPNAGRNEELLLVKEQVHENL